MARSRQAKIPVEGSWRMVEEGENDSFDTSIVHDPFDDDFISSGQSQLSASSRGLASQDSIRDFANRADDEQVILRAPFQPSLVSTRQASVDQETTPVPEFFMPTVEADGAGRSSGRSSRTIRPPVSQPQQMRRRGYPPDGSPRKQNFTMRAHGTGDRPKQTRAERFSASVPEVFFNSVAWALSILGMALQYAKIPLAALLAIYLCIGAGMMARNMITDSIASSLSPLCHLPLVDFPFCPDSSSASGGNATEPVEFDELMNVQSQFEKVLEDSAAGVSLPMEMKRTEASVRDLRTMVKYSDLPSRQELVYEFDGYIDRVRQISSDLQTFNTHVGSAVDSVISINRWTSRYIDSIASHREADNGLLSRGIDWLFSPFSPAVFDERMVLDKYIEHTALVSEKISNLIVEAHAALRLLTQAEDHLELIHEQVHRSNGLVKEQRSEVLWNIWTLVGANNQRLHSLRTQLSLLKQVDHQRSSAVSQLVGLVHDLGDIQTKLSDLRDRVAAPQLLDGGSSAAAIPLSVHIETINAGVERLEGARSRIRAEENERLQEALRRSREDDRLIEG
ncbi:hypothetical protein GGR56DRAFT_648358 [Xylariaceae sp. FL0804]|nr:hypothetical protein GGR56DRAFT_648358 [Xylariaceae sp. FL0804]